MDGNIQNLILASFGLLLLTVFTYTYHIQQLTEQKTFQYKNKTFAV